MSISKVRAILKKVKATGTVTNLPGRGPMSILPLCTASVEAKIRHGSLLENYREKYHLGVIKPPKLPHLHANKLFGKKIISCHFRCAWNLLNATGTLTGTMFYGQMKRKFYFSATKSQGGFGVKTIIPIPKMTCMKVLWRWRFHDVVGLSSKGPGNLVRVHGIMNYMKYQHILTLNLAASARKLKLGHCWIFQPDNDPKDTSISTQKSLTERKIQLLPWTSQSPDLNL